MSEPLVALSKVSLRFGDVSVLKEIDLTLHSRRITTLIGPNGAGKTSLAKVVLGLHKPSSGTLNRRAGLKVGYMPQRLRIDDSLPLTVDRFLWLAEPAHKDERRAALARVGVAALQHQPVQQLSGGEWQRVLLARALLRKADLLVLDEPAQGVDVIGQNALYGLLADVRDEFGCGILLISHDLHLVMAATDDVICLQHHVCCSGTPEAVSRDPAFHDLFAGTQLTTPNMALYTHDHDHAHDLHGNVNGDVDSAVAKSDDHDHSQCDHSHGQHHD